jgi:hypothetical protein
MLRKRSVVLSAFAAMSSFAIASGASADGMANLKDGPRPLRTMCGMVCTLESASALAPSTTT